MEVERVHGARSGSRTVLEVFFFVTVDVSLRDDVSMIKKIEIKKKKKCYNSGGTKKERGRENDNVFPDEPHSLCSPTQNEYT